MVVLSGGRTTMKLGSKIPVATGSYSGGGSGVQTQFQYLDVGLNIDASLDEEAGGMKLNSKVEQSSVSVAEEKTVGDVREPVIRQAVLTGAAMMTIGKPVMLGSLDVPGSTRHLDVEVVLENVK
jgi:type II secretory pathway component GspD/PulD (secretin)